MGSAHERIQAQAYGRVNFLYTSIVNLISIYLYLSTVLDPSTFLFRELYNMHQNFVKKSKVLNDNMIQDLSICSVYP